MKAYAETSETRCPGDIASCDGTGDRRNQHMKEVARREGPDEEELKKVRRKREVSGAIKVFCQLAVQKYGHTGASVARLLGVTTSSVNRYAAPSSGDSLELTRYA